MLSKQWHWGGAEGEVALGDEGEPTHDANVPIRFSSSCQSHLGHFAINVQKVYNRPWLDNNSEWTELKKQQMANWGILFLTVNVPDTLSTGPDLPCLQQIPLSKELPDNGDNHVEQSACLLRCIRSFKVSSRVYLSFRLQLGL